MLYETAGVIAACTLVAWCIEYFCDDPREPPRVRAKIPIPGLGHVIGWLWNGFDYPNRIGKVSDAEVCTVGVLNSKIYVVKTPRLHSIVHKTKTLSMQQITRNATNIHSGASAEAHALFDADVFQEFRTRTRSALLPSQGLDELNLRMAEYSVAEINEILGGKGDGSIELLRWSKHVILQSVSAGFYGVNHPFRDPEMEKAMWDWDKYRPTMHLKLDPFGKGTKARAKVFDALERYFSDIPEDVSPVVLERKRVLEDLGGIKPEDALKMQAFLNDGNFNVVPMLYWAVYDIYSRPALLNAIRKEVTANAVQRSESGINVLDMSAVKTKCPLLLGAYQETQRIRHMLPNSRYILEDTLLDGRYLLKKGRMLYLPTKPIHYDTNIWGPRAAEYDPYRFMPDAKSEGGNQLASHFLPWGTAPYICPARQFVSTGIMVTLAQLVLRVHLERADGRSWEDEPATQWLEIATLPTAREEVNLVVKPRAEGGGTWSVIIGTPKTAVPLKSR
ncbi:cytochrome P450 [Podospora australis]|uniref:Cytochrome P450 n=1 Tax=Podospora australis TaxID=1536484 RepID=A0AAN6WPC7_9PEZI|nr:cytochrome P450 [Podospora australis]